MNVNSFIKLKNCFPDKLKHSEVIPVYKKLDPSEKENYRPESLLSHVSKVFERIIYKQINAYMEDKISNYEPAIGKKEYIFVMYMDLSKAFDTINHDLF